MKPTLMPFLIKRAHPRRYGPYHNSPVRFDDWREVGVIRAESTAAALTAAEDITGAEREHLKVTGISFRSPE